MGLSFRYALIAAGLLTVTELLTQVLAAPAVAVTLPPVLSYQVPAWTPGRIDAQSIKVNGVRLIQEYTSAVSGDTATVETRCGGEPKEFLKWTGRLAYEGAGYEQVTEAVDSLPMPPGARVTDVLMRNAQRTVVILYGYIDHWGIHPETLSLWPRAIADLVARHGGLYCESAVAVPVTRSQQQARTEARDLAEAFLTRIDRSVNRSTNG